ncbi:MAG TPA: beta-galactosidase [Chloroflexota bacterium]
MGKPARSAITGVLVASFLLAIFTVMMPVASTGRPPALKPASVGFTFSERQADYLDVSWRQAFQAAMELMPNLVRLGAYWDSIETTPGKYDFSTLDWMLDNIPPQSSVLLVVGMKAPRWPEYYLPGWLRKSVSVGSGGDVAQDPLVRKATLRFVSQVVRHVRGRANVKYWQVENEPLDPSGPQQWTIDGDFLAQEIGLVRSLDGTRPIVASMFVDTSPLGALPPWRGQLQDRARQLLGLVDVLGLDVYPVRPVASQSIQASLKWPVWVWEARVRDLQQMAQAAGKQTWISEAQAEPWLPARLVYTGSAPSRNAAPSLTTSTVDRLQQDGFNTILLWGVEYWYMRIERYRDSNWWFGMQPFFHESHPSQAGLPSSA